MHEEAGTNFGTNHLKQADFCTTQIKKPTMLSNKRMSEWFVRRIGFLLIVLGKGRKIIKIGTKQ